MSNNTWISTAVVAWLIGLPVVVPAEAASPVDAAAGVIQRLIPQHAEQFVLEAIPQENGKDVFEIESRDGKIVLRGNNGVSICSALNWYLKYRCFCHVSWCGDQLNLPDPLPTVEPKVHQVSPHRYRYCLNYCAFGYMRNPRRGKLSGLGPIMENLGYNAVLYDLLTDLMWRTEMPELEPWAMEFAHRRYGRQSPKMQEAWKLLLETAYGEAGAGSDVVCLRPNLSGQRTKKPHRRKDSVPCKIAEAGRLYLACADELGGLDTYRFDLVNLVRQILGNLVQDDFEEITAAYYSKDRKRLNTVSQHFFGLVRGMDELLGTRREFMLGPWLADAKRWATNDDERKLYEWNARNQITLWGPPNSELHDYAHKEWSGLLVNFHLPRWELFVRRLDEALEAGKEFDADAFEKEMQQWEDQWAHGTKHYPAKPTGDSVAVARKLWDQYGKLALECE